MKPLTEREIFLEALEMPTPESRAAYLQAACGGDVVLYRKVDELLKEHYSNDSLLAGPALEGERAAEARPPASEAPAQMIGRYKLLEKLGEGGFGEVWMGEQREPVKRRVALKIIKLGMDSRQVVARFEAERQALAMMDHANIAKIFDADVTDNGRPYFVMELVRGIKITEYCDRNRLSTRERLDLFVQVCLAVQHAHQKGIIHRDLKPSNILVTIHNPGSPGLPKIIDFGIAKATQGKLTDQTLFTAFEQFLGTPAYMSPEQAMMTALDIDTRSDIYSLGVLLYELLTGRTPFDARELMAAGVDEMRRSIREKEPVRPSTRLSTLHAPEQATVASFRQTELPKLIHLVRGDLDWIVMKCLEKDRARRYETANDLATDIQRHLNHETVSARPVSTVYRIRKLVLRNKLAFAGATALVGMLVLGAVITSLQAIRATRAGQAAVASRKLAEQAQAKEQHQRELAEVRLYAADMYAAQRAFDDGNLGRTRDLLQAHLPAPGEPDLRGFEWRYLRQLCQGENFHTFSGHSNAVRCLAFSPDGMILASGGVESSVRLWDVKNRRPMAVLPAHNNSLYWVAFSNDGESLATVGDDGIKLWNVETHHLIYSLRETNAARIAFSPVGKLIAIGYGHPVFSDSFGGPMKLWDYVAHQVVKTFPEPGSRLAFSPDGKILAASSNNQALKLWNIETGEEIRRIDNAGEVYALSFSPDGQTVAAVNSSGGALLWSVVTGAPRLPLKGHTGEAWSLAFSPDGRMLATGGDHLRLWNIATGTEDLKLIGHGSEVRVVAFAPDGRTLATGGKDAMVMLWSAVPKRSDIVITNVERPPSFSPDSKLLATKKREGPITLWDMASRHPVWVLNGEKCPEFFNEGKTLATIATNSALRFWDVAKQTLQRSVPLPGITDSTQEFHFSLHGKYLAAVRDDGANIVLHDATTGAVIGNIKGQPALPNALVFSPDARLLAASFEDYPPKIWDVATQNELAMEPSHKHAAQGLAFSPDGSILASASWDETIGFLNLATGKAEPPLTGIKGGCSGVAFSPDAKTLAVACEDGAVRLWNLATRREVVVLRHGRLPVHYVEFSPNGQALVSVCWDDSTMRFWDAPSPADL